MRIAQRTGKRGHYNIGYMGWGLGGHMGAGETNAAPTTKGPTTFDTIRGYSNMVRDTFGYGMQLYMQKRAMDQRFSLAKADTRIRGYLAATRGNYITPQQIPSTMVPYTPQSANPGSGFGMGGYMPLVAIGLLAVAVMR